MSTTHHRTSSFCASVSHLLSTKQHSWLLSSLGNGYSFVCRGYLPATPIQTKLRLEIYPRLGSINLACLVVLHHTSMTRTWYLALVLRVEGIDWKRPKNPKGLNLQDLATTGGFANFSSQKRILTKHPTCI